jgi:hypothetical protein
MGGNQTFAAGANSKGGSKKAAAQSINQFFQCANAANRGNEPTLPKIGTSANDYFWIFRIGLQKKSGENFTLMILSKPFTVLYVDKT